jgi:hypothetical protein
MASFVNPAIAAARGLPTDHNNCHVILDEAQWVKTHVCESLSAGMTTEDMLLVRADLRAAAADARTDGPRDAVQMAVSRPEALLRLADLFQDVVEGVVSSTRHLQHSVACTQQVRRRTTDPMCCTLCRDGAMVVTQEALRNILITSGLDGDNARRSLNIMKTVGHDIQHARVRHAESLLACVVGFWDGVGARQDVTVGRFALSDTSSLHFELYVADPSIIMSRWPGKYRSINMFSATPPRQQDVVDWFGNATHVN